LTQAFLRLSPPVKVKNPNYYRHGQAKLRRLQRILARAKHGSKNRYKALRAVQRRDFL
jgi:transposase